jgi:hypothetical protein
MVNWMQFLYAFHCGAVAWSPQHHGLLVSAGSGTANHCIRFWSAQDSGYNVWTLLLKLLIWPRQEIPLNWQVSCMSKLSLVL